MNFKYLILPLLLISCLLFAQTKTIHHEISVSLSPAKSFIDVTDKITIPTELIKGGMTFLLNQKLIAEAESKNITLSFEKKLVSAKDVGMDREGDETFGNLKLIKYKVTHLANVKNNLTFTIHYKGTIDSPIEQSAENYQRGFSQSPGIIDKPGVFLAGSTYWVPSFGDELVTFNLTVKSPKDWKTVSQGKRTINKDANEFHIDKWECNTPQEEVFLIAAKFTEYSYAAGAVTAMAFLRTPDENLANKYLETTAQYLEMDRQLIGKYPYSKFALVENFWETGYGMPSFTLLGEKIIRFPFILHSSYPHELLHNWWGNSVYVDFKKGNWCEGLTAYMADHLIKEQRGQGVEYRRGTLQRFTDYVNDKNDFPISKFVSRYDGASEAIGYGKTLMMYHMLRRKVGDDNFKKAFQIFYRNNKFKVASFDDIEKAFEDATGKDYKAYFKQWINRKGAPQLELKNVHVKKVDKNYNLRFDIIQTQKDKPFTIDIPIIIADKFGTKTMIIHSKDRDTKFSLSARNKPLTLFVDPQFDVFRRLDPREIPASFSKAYGSKSMLIILPNKTDKLYSLYKNFADEWIKGSSSKIEIKNGDEISKLPADKTVFLLGINNKYFDKFNIQLAKHNSHISTDSVKLAGTVLPTAQNDFFFSVKNKNNPAQVVLFLKIGKKEAVAGLVRKLPHYGKYSYLAFQGNEPTNIAKGQWTVTESPLIAVLDKSAKYLHPKFEKRKALAYLPPVFSAKRMLNTVKYLASDELKGRGLGTPELNKAADFIAEKFKKYGLQPGGENGTYFQTWNTEIKGIKFHLKNIIAVIPGNDAKLKNEAVVVSAHYDHLGLGWPDVHKGDKGKIHHGADDNASGVAVMLELAKILNTSLKPAHTLIFVAFTGEEEGLVGSNYFVNNYKPFSKNKIFADLNLDTVGRLFGNKLLILNGDSAKDWKFIFMGIEYVTGVGIDMVTQKLDASDQVSFLKNSIPSVQFFSGPNTDYHRPTDTADKIDADGMVKIATAAKEAIEYLTERGKPMPFTGTENKSTISKSNEKKSKSGRRVSTGSIPDFAFSGTGVKLSGVVPNSPVAKAGLRKGDIITKFGGKAISNLRDYSNLLKKHKPGDSVSVEFVRNGKVNTATIVLKER